jgi:hypothetical protein
MNMLLTVRELLTTETLPFDHHVLLPDDPKWNAQTSCAIVESDEIANPEEHPLAVANGLTISIGTNEVRDIIYNAQEQIADATFDQLLEAFQFYLDNDAFIDFGGA